MAICQDKEETLSLVVERVPAKPRVRQTNRRNIQGSCRIVLEMASNVNPSPGGKRFGHSYISRQVAFFSSSFMKPITTSFRNYFLAGLAFAIPLVATGWLLLLVYKAVEKISAPIVAFLLPAEIDPHRIIVSATGMLIIVSIILGLGFMARNVIGKRVLAAVDTFFLGIPVIAFIYRSLKQAIESFKSFGNTQRFQRVAYVEYPSPGSRLIGFVTGHYFDPQLQKGVTCVFVPTSPNPLTGFVILVEDDKVMDSPLSLEEATKLVFSAGLISPQGKATAPTEIDETSST
jgi:uncharacterized membrane protein